MLKKILIFFNLLHSVSSPLLSLHLSLLCFILRINITLHTTILFLCTILTTRHNSFPSISDVSPQLSQLFSTFLYFLSFIKPIPPPHSSYSTLCYMYSLYTDQLIAPLKIDYICLITIHINNRNYEHIQPYRYHATRTRNYILIITCLSVALFTLFS